jgi:hypothetical protein
LCFSLRPELLHIDLHEELTGASQWARRSANKDGMWKALYFERWSDPCSHQQEREGSRLGWKKVNAQAASAPISIYADLHALSSACM